MKTYTFKTNINCGNCVQKVTPFLQKLEGAEWTVDTGNKDKILTVKGESVNKDQVIELVREAGYEITPQKKGFLSGLFK